MLIDSWAWIEYFRGSPAGRKVRPIIEGAEEAVISSINVAEVFRWFLRDATPTQAEWGRRVLTRRCAIRDLDADLAVEAARLRHAKGWGLGDAIVYATAQAVQARLLTGDPDFKGMPGVEFVAG